MKRGLGLLLLYTFISISCSAERISAEEENLLPKDTNTTEENPALENNNTKNNFKILSLGDSYTIGESVCETCRFPEQLKQKLISETDSKKEFQLKIIARTGWTTTNLISALNSEEALTGNYDLVTLLIGVNNQYQNKPFSLYETEFPELISKAKSYIKNTNNLIVVSIPDYAFTPFGKGDSSISAEIDKYNAFAENYCLINNISFVNITDITRRGLENSALVASDGLHPSELAYLKFVERIVPLAILKLEL